MMTSIRIHCVWGTWETSKYRIRVNTYIALTTQLKALVCMFYIGLFNPQLPPLSWYFYYPSLKMGKLRHREVRRLFHCQLSHVLQNMWIQMSRSRLCILTKYNPLGMSGLEIGILGSVVLLDSNLHHRADRLHRKSDTDSRAGNWGLRC